MQVRRQHNYPISISIRSLTFHGNHGIGRATGLYHAMKAIMAAQGARGLFQGHLATLLRIFPYAGVKFMAYDKLDGVGRAVH